MFKLLCLFFLNTFMIQWAFSRHIARPQCNHQQSSYLPYTDVDSINTDSGYYQQLYPQAYQQSPLYTPPGTYFDQRRGVLRPFPGGGVPVLVDYHKRCSNHFVGLKAHPEDQQYYYVCKPDCVIFGKCQHLQIFNSTNGQCVQHPPPEYMPSCTKEGRFPLFSDCHLYYKCDEDLKAKIYSCPSDMIFSAVSQKCIRGNKCTPTQISPQSSYIPEYCANKFPPCYENGIFRSPSDCSLYYSCELQQNGIYLQTRLRCPDGFFYDLKKNNCLPANQVPCDCIQVAELVYPKANGSPLLYPAQFNLDSLEENVYPIEHTKEEISLNKCKNVSDRGDLSFKASEHGESNSKTIPSEELVLQVDSLLINKDLTKLESDSTAEDSEENTTEALKVTTTETPRVETETIPNIEIHNSPIIESMALILEESTNTTETPAIAIITEEPATSSQEFISTPEKISVTEIQATTISNLVNTPEEMVVLENKKSRITSKDTSNSENITTTTSAVIPPEADLQFPCIETNEIESADDKAEPKDTLRPQLQTKSCKPSFINTTQDTTDTDQQTKAKTLVSEFTRGSRSTLLQHKDTPTKLMSQEPSTNLETKKDQKELKFNIKIATSSSMENVENFLTTENIVDSERNLIITPDSATQAISKHFTQNSSTFKNNLVDSVTDNAHEKLSENISNTILKRTMISTENFLEDTTNIETTPTSVASNFNIKGEMKNIKISPSNFDKTLDNFESFSKALLDEELFSATSKHKNNIDLNADTSQDNEFIKPSIFNEEELLPVHSKIIDTAERPEETTEFDYITNNPAENNSFDINLDYDFTTIITKIENTKTKSLKGGRDNIKNLIMDTGAAQDLPFLKRRQTTHPQSMAVTTLKPILQITLAAKPVTTTETTVSKLNENKALLILQKNITSGDLLRVNNITRNEVDSFETRSAEIVSTSLLPHTLLDSSSRIQTPTTTPNFIPHTIPTNNHSVKHIWPLLVKVREQQSLEDSQESNNSKNLYYILRIKPVNKTITTTRIMNNNNTITESARLQSNSENIPRLDIIVERPIDVHFKICPLNCDKTHTRNFSSTGNRAVFVKWFANKSNQTLGFETANEEVNTLSDEVR